MRLSAMSLGLKLNLALLAFLIVLGASTAGLILYGFDRTQNSATSASRKGIEDFSVQVIHAFVRLVATSTSLRFAKSAEDATFAAQFLADARKAGSVTRAWDPARLVTAPGGERYDPSPERLADTWLPASAVADAAALTRLANASALDSLMPALLQSVPEDIGAYFAGYFLGASGEIRRYPAQPDPAASMTKQDVWARPEFAAARPAANPKRSVVWTPPYQDAKRGWIVSVLAPIYTGDEFVGVLGFDVLLDRLVAEIDGTHPTDDGYAFFIDRSGALLQTSHSKDVTEALPHAGNEALVQALAGMRAGEKGFARARLAGEDVIVAYAPIDGFGGSMGFVAPVDKLLSEIRASDTADLIEKEGDRTLRLTLAAMGALFCVGLVSATYLNRRVLLRPIQAMVSGTRAVAGGNLETVIPTSGKDELASLARSFNDMTAEIRERRDSLERQVEERTRELTILLETSTSVASTLELRPLLQLLLEHIGRVVDYWRVTLFLLEGETLNFVLARTNESHTPPESPTPWLTPQDRSTPLLPVLQVEEMRLLWDELSAGRPVIVDDVFGDSEMAEVWRRTNATPASENPRLACRLVVPLILRDKIIGMMGLAHADAGFYTSEQADLVMAIASQAAVAIENARLYEQAGKLAAVEERQRLARELHDSVSQALYGIALSGTAAQTLLSQGDSAAKQPVDFVLTLAQAAMAEMRALIFELRPESLEVEGLIAALNKQIAATTARHGIAVEASLPEEPKIPLAVKEVFYRVCQESLQNIVKHASARVVIVRLIEAAGRLTLEVIDDGAGFDTSQTFPGHMGLISMPERAATIGALYEITSAPGQGTTVRLSIPYETETSAASSS